VRRINGGAMTVRWVSREDQEDSETHEGAITEPIEGVPLGEPPAPEGGPRESTAAPMRPQEESERHEGAITEPEEQEE
jgi:hypothetical protein